MEEIFSRCHEEVAAVGDGRLPEVPPARTRADVGRFGLALAGTDGRVHEVGDARVPFTLMSVAKPFVHALACQEHGTGVVRDLVGVDATGLSFNSAIAVERAPGGRTNPMVNAGAIQGDPMEATEPYSRQSCLEVIGVDLSRMGALGTYSPLLDAHGNGVRGVLAAQWLSEESGLDILASVAASSGGPPAVDEGGNA